MALFGMPFQKTNSNARYGQNPGDEDGTHAVITGVEPLYVRYGVYGWLVQRGLWHPWAAAPLPPSLIVPASLRQLLRAPRKAEESGWTSSGWVTLQPAFVNSISLLILGELQDVGPPRKC